MKVLGIDPGSQLTGWGVVETRGANVVSLGAGVLKLGRGAMEGRLVLLYDGLAAVLAEHRPDEVAVEDVFYAKHANAAIKLGHARGVVLLAAAKSGLAVTAYPPALVKRTVAGRGAADKAQVARLVGAILGLTELPPIDATDALAIAITHARAAKVNALAPKTGRRRR